MVDRKRLKEVVKSGGRLGALRRAAGLGEIEGCIEPVNRRSGSGAQLQAGGLGDADVPLSGVWGLGQGERATGRRPWLCAPSWMSPWLEQPFERQHTVEVAEEGWMRHTGRARDTEGRGRRDHVIVIKGPIAYCARCAQFAIVRLGKGLKGFCAAPQQRTLNATQARLNRLREGKHPITGRPIDLGCQ